MKRAGAAKPETKKVKNGLRAKLRRGQAGAVRKRKFLLTYDGFEDPRPQDVTIAIKAFAPARVTEVLPGTLAVSGPPARIRRSAEKLETWSLSTEGQLSQAPPTRIRTPELME